MNLAEIVMSLQVGPATCTENNWSGTCRTAVRHSGETQPGATMKLDELFGMAGKVALW